MITFNPYANRNYALKAPAAQTQPFGCAKNTYRQRFSVERNTKWFPITVLNPKTHTAEEAKIVQKECREDYEEYLVVNKFREIIGKMVLIDEGADGDFLCVDSLHGDCFDPENEQYKGTGKILLQLAHEISKQKGYGGDFTVLSNPGVYTYYKKIDLRPVRPEDEERAEREIAQEGKPKGACKMQLTSEGAEKIKKMVKEKPILIH